MRRSQSVASGDTTSGNHRVGPGNHAGSRTAIAKPIPDLPDAHQEWPPLGRAGSGERGRSCPHSRGARRLAPVQVEHPRRHTVSVRSAPSRPVHCRSPSGPRTPRRSPFVHVGADSLGQVRPRRHTVYQRVCPSSPSTASRTLQIMWNQKSSPISPNQLRCRPLSACGEWPRNPQ